MVKSFMKPTWKSQLEGIRDHAKIEINTCFQREMIIKKDIKKYHIVKMVLLLQKKIEVLDL